MEGISSSVDETAQLVDENDFSWELNEILREEFKLISLIPKLRKAYDDYAKQTPLLTGESIEYKFGFNLATDRLNGMGFHECGLDSETEETLAGWAEELGTPDFYLRSNGKIDASW